VIQRASDDARIATASAMSSGSPSRPSAAADATLALATGLSRRPANTSVRMTPGATAFTVMPRPPSSTASVRVITSIAPLLIT
jgi:hypothetical protein